jgi:hypothetical protein
MSTTTSTPATTVQTPLQTATGNVQAQYLMQVTWSPTAVTENTTVATAFTVTGILAGDLVQVSKPTNQAGLVIGNVFTAANTVTVNFGNLTGSTITPTASEVYTLLVTRPMAAVVTDGYPSTLPTS